MRILHVIDTFEISDNVRQLQMLGPALQLAAASVEICCLGPETPALESLRRRGLIVHALHWTRWFDPSVLFNLRAILREAMPDVIHVWGLPALRMLALVASDWLSRVVLSGPPSRTHALPWWDRYLLGKVPYLAVGGASDLPHFAAAGIVPPRLQVIPPPLAPSTAAAAPAAHVRIRCTQESYRHAIWTFDFVRLLYPAAILELVGARAREMALRSLADGLDCDKAIEFLDAPSDADADVVWIPSLSNHGRQAALDAMARGQAVIASDVPCLREIITDGVTGYLVTPGEVVQIARRSRMLLDDAALRARLGAAAREFIARQFPLERTIDHWRELYRRIAA